jgi:hypothetical protein
MISSGYNRFRPSGLGFSLMDTTKVLRDLKKELARVEHALAVLEQRASAPRNPRGRKSMGAEERVQVAERMKAYWERRREQAGAAAAESGTKARGAAGS